MTPLQRFLSQLGFGFVPLIGAMLPGWTAFFYCAESAEGPHPGGGCGFFQSVKSGPVTCRYYFFPPKENVFIMKISEHLKSWQFYHKCLYRHISRILQLTFCYIGFITYPSIHPSIHQFPFLPIPHPSIRLPTSPISTFKDKGTVCENLLRTK